jgi:hypothetical protein
MEVGVEGEGEGFFTTFCRPFPTQLRIYVPWSLLRMFFIMEVYYYTIAPEAKELECTRVRNYYGGSDLGGSNCLCH